MIACWPLAQLLSLENVSGFLVKQDNSICENLFIVEIKNLLDNLVENALAVT